MNRLHQKSFARHGFTIVELLIVIVVIGILAAITIVAYNGIQQKARNVQTVNAISNYTKALMHYASETGTYPAVRSPLSCLGVGYVCDGTTNSATNTQALITELSPYMSTTPQPAIGARVGDRTGALLAGSGTSDRYILFIQEGTLSCPSIGGLTQRVVPDVSAGNIACRYNLPPL